MLSPLLRFTISETTVESGTSLYPDRGIGTDHLRVNLDAFSARSVADLSSGAIFGVKAVDIGAAGARTITVAHFPRPGFSVGRPDDALSSWDTLGAARADRKRGCLSTAASTSASGVAGGKGIGKGAGCSGKCSKEDSDVLHGAWF